MSDKTKDSSLENEALLNEEQENAIAEAETEVLNAKTDEALTEAEENTAEAETEVLNAKADEALAETESEAPDAKAVAEETYDAANPKLEENDNWEFRSGSITVRKTSKQHTLCT